jgi:hypothetical protein
MDVWFEIWNIENGNIIGDFDSEEAALRFVRTSIRSFGHESVDSFVLIRETNEENDPETIATGGELADLARGYRHGVKS